MDLSLALPQHQILARFSIRGHLRERLPCTLTHTRMGRLCTLAKTLVLLILFLGVLLLSSSLHLLSTSFFHLFLHHSVPLSSHFSLLSPLSVSPSARQTTWHSSKTWLKRMISSLRSFFPSSLPLSLPFFLSLSFFLSRCYGLKQRKNVDCNRTEDCQYGTAFPLHHHHPLTFNLAFPFHIFSFRLCRSAIWGLVPLVHNHEQALGATWLTRPSSAWNWVSA